MDGKDGGFTLIELSIVILLVSILAMAVTTRYISQVKKAKDSTTYAVVGAYRSAYNLYLTDNGGKPPGSIDEIGDNVRVSRSSFDIAEGSSGTTSSIQVLAGTVKKGASPSQGYGDFAGKTNVAELYYDSTERKLYIDGTKGGTDYEDTKGDKWNEN